MPEVTDPELLRALNGGGGGPVYGAPRAPREAPPGYRFRPDGAMEIVPGGPADPERPDKPPAGYDRGPDGTLKPTPGGPAARQLEKDAEGSVEQNKARGFMTRGLQANTDYLSLGPVEPRSLPGQAIADRFPNLANTLFNDADRQKADQAERAFIGSILRYDSGAAIPPQEFVTQGQIYFPRPGDTPEVIAQKARARIVALQSLKDAAGPTAKNDVIPDDNWYYDPELGMVGTVTDEGAPPAGPGRPEGPSENGPTPPEERDPSGLGGLAALAKQGVTLGLSDEAAGLGGLLSGYLTGEDPTKAYGRERDTERAFLDRARKEWGIAGTGAELLGGGGAARIAAVPMTLGSVMRQGSGLGATGGFGYGEGVDSVPMAALGGAGGAALGAGLYGVGRGIASRLGSQEAPDMAVIEAGQRQNIPIRQPDAFSRLRGRYAAAESSEHGGPAIRAERAADLDAIEQRVAGVGGSGAALDPYALGNQVQGAGQRYIARTKQQASQLYRRAEQEAGNASVQPTETVAAVERNIAELRAAGENSNSGQIAYLEGLREDLSKPLSIQAVQNLRTNMRGQIGERGLTNTDAERRVGQIIDAANMDLTRELPQSASTALRAADDFYRQRQEFINGTLKQFMGSKGAPLPAETASQRLISMTQGRGNFDRFSSMWRELEPTEQADAAATIAASLGRLRNGNFSAAELIKSLDPKKGINPRTARLVFGDDGAAALSDLRAITQAKSDAMNRLSPSGQSIAKQAGTLKTILAGVLGLGAGGPAGAAAGAVSREFLSRWGEQRAARMLLNPDFTKWLRNAPNTTNPRVIDRYFSRLAGLGSVAANDNQAFTNALSGALRQSPSHVASAEERTKEN